MSYISRNTPPRLGNLRKNLRVYNRESFAVIKGCEALTVFLCAFIQEC